MRKLFVFIGLGIRGERSFGFTTAALGMLLLLQGCASIVSGTTQVVSVETPGCPEASCELTNEKGKWYLSRTPGTVSVSRAYGPLSVSCKMKDVNATVSFQSATKGMAFGNILLGGFIGAGVDMSSGAAYDYPQTLSVPMACPASAQAEAPVQIAGGARTGALKLGIRAESVSEALQITMGLEDRKGIVIVAVDEGGVGHSMGLKVGNVLLEFNGKPIVSTEALAKELSILDTTAPLEFVVFDGKRKFRVTRGSGTL